MATARTANTSASTCILSARPSEEHWVDHLVNSRRTFLLLVEKARSFNEKTAQKLVADRNYQALDQMVIEHLLGK